MKGIESTHITIKLKNEEIDTLRSIVDKLLTKQIGFGTINFSEDEDDLLSKIKIIIG